MKCGSAFINTGFTKNAIGIDINARVTQSPSNVFVFIFTLSKVLVLQFTGPLINIYDDVGFIFMVPI